MIKQGRKAKQTTGFPRITTKKELNKMDKVGAPPFSSKIIKGGALLQDTRTLLSAWDTIQSVNENLRRMRYQNLLGKSSRSRVEDILHIFRQRYLTEESVTRALVKFVNRQSNGNTLDRILYYHSMRADSLLYNLVLDVLLPLWENGIQEVDIPDIEKYLRKWVEEGKTSGTWGDYTIRRIAQGSLSAFRDFGVLQGAKKKRIAPAYLSIQAFSYITFYLKQHQPSGAKLIDLNDWKLFFLSSDGVEHFLIEAHQRGLLEYHVAGSVIRLTFPVKSLEEYVDVLT